MVSYFFSRVDQYSKFCMQKWDGLWARSFPSSLDYRLTTADCCFRLHL